jgi:hypothetical protein
VGIAEEEEHWRVLHAEVLHVRGHPAVRTVGLADEPLGGCSAMPLNESQCFARLQQSYQLVKSLDADYPAVVNFMVHGHTTNDTLVTQNFAAVFDRGMMDPLALSQGFLHVPAHKPHFRRGGGAGRSGDHAPGAGRGEFRKFAIGSTIRFFLKKKKWNRQLYQDFPFWPTNSTITPVSIGFHVPNARFRSVAPSSAKFRRSAVGRRGAEKILYCTLGRPSQIPDFI